MSEARWRALSPDATAWPNRSGAFHHERAYPLARQGRGLRPASPGLASLYEAAAPFAAGSVYVNFMPEDESDRVENAYGANYRRLAEIKRRYDPDNRFRMNQNIRTGVRSSRGQRKVGLISIRTDRDGMRNCEARPKCIPSTAKSTT